MDQQNENVQWLSLLPLFEADHWPVNGRSRVRHIPELGPIDAEWLCECMCDDYDHVVVCVFPYARMGTRDAWCIFEDTLREVRDESARQEITMTWPYLWHSIFHQLWDHNELMFCRYEANPCEEAGYNFPYWDTSEVTYERCDCLHSDEEDDPELDYGEFTLVFRFREEDPEGEYAVPGRYGVWSEGRPLKGYTIGEHYEWDYVVTGESDEADQPPPYEVVSELPSYEESQSLVYKIFPL